VEIPALGSSAPVVPAVSADPGVGHCWGANRAVHFDEPFTFTSLAARRSADREVMEDFLSVTFAYEEGEATDHTPSTYWRGVFVTFEYAGSLTADDFPLELDLQALPPGWEVGVGQYGGGCKGPEGPCKSNASAALSSMMPLFEGTLQVSAGPRQTVTLCLKARGAEYSGPVELFMWVDALELEEMVL
jgi:hypothetical protein